MYLECLDKEIDKKLEQTAEECRKIVEFYNNKSLIYRLLNDCDSMIKTDVSILWMNFDFWKKMRRANMEFVEAQKTATSLMEDVINETTLPR